MVSATGEQRLGTFLQGKPRLFGTSKYKFYSTLAPVFDVLYEEQLDYDQQHRFCREQLPADCDSVLEIGCGTGHLTRCLEQDYDVTALDIEESVLDIAKNRVTSELVLGDMRQFSLHRRFDAIIVLGRTFAHMVTEDEVFRALDRIAAHLKPGGTLVMDNFKTAAVKEQAYTEEYQFGDIHVKRSNKNTDIEDRRWTWHATYDITDTETGKSRFETDDIRLRGFTKQELQERLEQQGMHVRQHYANVYGDTNSAGAHFVTVAEKQ